MNNAIRAMSSKILTLSEMILFHLCTITLTTHSSAHKNDFQFIDAKNVEFINF